MSTSALMPVDIEGELVTYLRPLVDVHVSTRIPNPRPAAFVRVTRAGGTRINLVQERPLIVVECWGPDSVSAFELASRTWAHLAAREDTDQSGMSSPINMPDPDTSSARYQFTTQPIVRLKEMPS